MRESPAYAAAVFDLDGTLLQDGALTREAKAMLLALKKAGVRVIIATGRHLGVLPGKLKNPAYTDQLILCNGAVLLNTGEAPFFRASLQAPELRELFSLCAPFSCRYAVSCGSRTRLSRKEPPLRNRTDGGGGAKRKPWNYILYPLCSRFSPSWEAYLSRGPGLAEKVACTPLEPGEELALRAKLNQSPLFEATGAARAVEVTKKGISKGSALAMLAEKYKIDISAVVSFGNDDNDVTLKKASGLFIAAKGASPLARAEAAFEADSIPDAVRRLFKIDF